MIELGQLERRADDFASRNARVIVASIEGVGDARQTQDAFPHLLVLADEKRSLAQAAGVIHPQSAPDGGDTAAPTTIVVDRHGAVRWLYRSEGVAARLSPDDILNALAQHLP